MVFTTSGEVEPAEERKLEVHRRLCTHLATEGNLEILFH